MQNEARAHQKFSQVQEEPCYWSPIALELCLCADKGQSFDKAEIAMPEDGKLPKEIAHLFGSFRPERAVTLLIQVRKMFMVLFKYDLNCRDLQRSIQSV